MSTFRIATVIAVGSLVCLAVQASQAAPITIDNHSFENATGYWAESTAPSSWLRQYQNISGKVADQSYAADITNSTAENKDGNNYLNLFIYAGATPSSNTVTAWVESVSLGTYQANTVYTLTVAQTANSNVTHRQGIIALVAGGNIAASTGTPFNLLNTTGLASGIIFQDKQVVLDTSVTPAVVGQSISVRLLHEAGPGSQGYRHAYFDNVRLDASPIPEPATLGLMAIGGLMMLPRRR